MEFLKETDVVQLPCGRVGKIIGVRSNEENDHGLKIFQKEAK